MEVKGPYMHANRRLILIQNWCYTRDFQLTKQVAIDIAKHRAGWTLDKNEAQGALPRKVSKASTLSTPGQRFTEKSRPASVYCLIYGL
jgi:hypothetical protein